MHDVVVMYIKIVEDKQRVSLVRENPQLIPNAHGRRKSTFYSRLTNCLRMAYNYIDESIFI